MLTQQWIERIESIKSGLLSALALTGVSAVGSVINPVFVHRPTIALEIGIAAFSGILFGITYRHLVGTGEDDHLQSGAIGAFALVRGLAQAELFWMYGEKLACKPSSHASAQSARKAASVQTLQTPCAVCA